MRAASSATFGVASELCFTTTTFLPAACAPTSATSRSTPRIASSPSAESGPLSVAITPISIGAAPAAPLVVCAPAGAGSAAF
ncbi:hypothetical protein WME89_01175 [Sorangium sp. So ce321]